MPPPDFSPDNDLIFISIAAYRDLQLTPTVKDLLAKADEPALLRFGICWQHGPEETSLAFDGDIRFRVLDIPWQQSLGACWARASIMKLWQGEQWFLQVDSHCRFVQGWDTKLIRMCSETLSPRPILSTYANAFIPAEPGTTQVEILSGPAQLMAIETFTSDGIPQLKPIEIPNLAQRPRPMAARFLAAGFLFAPGSFVQDVPYDPELYFFGEEISMTLRAWTSGYDLFHPVETVVWHDYVRAYATRHWLDHDPAKLDTPAETSGWSDLDTRSREKVKSLLTSPDAPASDRPPFGLGAVRTREQYEAFSGVYFQLRKIQDYTRLALEPPNPAAAPDWLDHIYTWMVRITLNPADLAHCAFDETGFWMVTVFDQDRREIRRYDFSKDELKSFTGQEPLIALLCEIESGIVPVFWTVWPYSRTRGWGQKLDGTLTESDFSIIREDNEPVSTP